MIKEQKLTDLILLEFLYITVLLNYNIYILLFSYIFKNK